MSCASILNNIVAAEAQRDAAIATQIAKTEEFKDNNCKESWFGMSTPCQQIQDAMNAAKKTIDSSNATLKTLVNSYSRAGCEEVGPDCSNAGVNFLNCVTIPSLTCDNHKTHSKKCCDLETQKIYLTNLLAAAFSRKNEIQACGNAKRDLFYSAQAAAKLWTDGTVSSKKEKLFNSWKGAFASACDALGITSTSSSGTIEFQGPLSDDQMIAWGNKFVEVATSASTFASILGFELPSIAESSGPTDPIIMTIPECSGVTTIPSLTFNCYSEQEAQAVETAKNNVETKLRNKYKSTQEKDQFIRKIVAFQPGAKKFVMTEGTCGNQLGNKSSGGLNSVANQIIADAIKEYKTQTEAMIVQFEAIKKQITEIEKEQKRVIKEQQEFLAQFGDLNSALQNDFNMGVQSSLIGLIKDHIQESVTITYRDIPSLSLVTETYPPATGTFGKQLYTVCSESVVFFGDGVDKRFPIDEEYCPAKSNETDGKHYAYPITLNGTVKIIMSDADIEAARGLAGIKDLTKAEQDTLINSLNNCSKTLNYCIGQSS